VLSGFINQKRKDRLKVDAAARTILSGLKEAGINLIASLPDINLAELLRLIEQDRDVIHVPLCREEEE